MVSRNRLTIIKVGKKGYHIKQCEHTFNQDKYFYICGVNVLSTVQSLNLHMCKLILENSYGKDQNFIYLFIYFYFYFKL